MTNPVTMLLEKNCLVGPNYVDWLRNLRIVLGMESLTYVLDSPAPVVPGDDASEDDRAAYAKWQKDEPRVKGYMLASMNNELQRSHSEMKVDAMLLHLKELYGEHSRSSRYSITEQLFHCKLVEGNDVGEHVLKMIGWIERLESLDFYMDAELQNDLILQSLPPSFNAFIVNYNLNKAEMTLTELMNQLSTAQT